MNNPSQNSVRNYLLRLMSPDDFSLICSNFVPFKADRGTILYKNDDPIEEAYFFEAGVGSLITMSTEGQAAESGLFGRDGFCPTALIMGSDRSACDCVVQVPAEGYRMPVDFLVAAVEDRASLRNLLLRYVQAQNVQTAHTALSNAVHHVDQRLARWLLMIHDRIDGHELQVTHEFLSLMLAVRRPSVTTALHTLEGELLIRSERGCIIVRDRPLLEAYARGAYGSPEAEYERLLMPVRRQE